MRPNVSEDPSQPPQRSVVFDAARDELGISDTSSVRPAQPAIASALYRVSRTSGFSASENNTTSSPVVVLMSWCRLTTFTPVTSVTP